MQGLSSPGRHQQITATAEILGRKKKIGLGYNGTPAAFCCFANVSVQLCLISKLSSNKMGRNTCFMLILRILLSQWQDVTLSRFLWVCFVQNLSQCGEYLILSSAYSHSSCLPLFLFFFSPPVNGFLLRRRFPVVIRTGQKDGIWICGFFASMPEVKRGMISGH